jgi:hypothetical protein
MAVGKERFRGAAADVMAYLQTLQAAGLEPDDPTSSYMLQVGVRGRGGGGGGGCMGTI